MMPPFTVADMLSGRELVRIERLAAVYALVAETRMPLAVARRLCFVRWLVERGRLV